MKCPICNIEMKSKLEPDIFFWQECRKGCKQFELRHYISSKETYVAVRNQVVEMGKGDKELIDEAKLDWGLKESMEDKKKDNDWVADAVSTVCSTIVLVVLIWVFFR